MDAESSDDTLREIARYLRLGGTLPEGGLRARIEALRAEAPLHPAGRWTREGDTVYLCGTLGAAFDAWQRRLAVVSAADAFVAQAVGTAALEREMDALEAEARASLASGETLAPRRSPGYGELPLSLSREILDRLDATRRLGVTLTASLLLAPSKSVTALCAVTRGVMRFAGGGEK